MSDEKPLHARTAEALGWTNCHDRGDGLWIGDVTEHGKNNTGREIPRFDISWCSTGPLIQKHVTEMYEMLGGSWWVSAYDSTQMRTIAEVEKPTILSGVCHLILELHKQGKLKA